MKRTSKTINWEELMVEFLSGNESLNAFRIRHGLHRDWFYSKAEGWDDERRKIREESVKDAGTRIKETYGKFVCNLTDYTEDISQQVKAVFESTFDKQGKRARLIPTKDLVNLSTVILNTVKTMKLITGEAYGKEQEPPNVHLEILKIIEEARKNDAVNETRLDYEGSPFVNNKGVCQKRNEQ